ncbi:MAG: hypothetical protein F4Y87_00870 [Synechococcus sp. SB0665_bin_28]|nr:hypothetical protein [Synechococcus sp. SB0665_bin_28]MYF20851.1 hypothetical protein [Synechococcus sp. SB0677_bin_5]
MKILLLAGVGIILLVGAVLLLRRRRRLRTQIPPSPKRTNAAEVENPVQEEKDLPPSSSPEQPAAVQGVAGSRAMGPQQRRQMLRYLKSAYDSGSQARLDAMEDMVAWGHPACLPLLRRGLRDADLRVVGLAARGLERFRGPRQRLKHPPRRRRRRGHYPSTPV